MTGPAIELLEGFANSTNNTGVVTDTKLCISGFCANDSTDLYMNENADANANCIYHL